MRLINADKTKNSLWGFERYTGIDEMPIEYAEEIIDKQPTVEAIPIEWIVNWLTKQTIPATHTCDDYEAVEMMLDDWEKENEAN